MSTRRNFLITTLAAGFAGQAEAQQAAAPTNIIIIPLTVSKDQADAASKRFDDKVKSELEKAKAEAAKASGVAVPAQPEPGRAQEALRAADTLRKRIPGFGGKKNVQGADLAVLEEIAKSATGGAVPVILVYGDAAKAESLKGILAKEAGLSSTIVIRNVDPASNKEFKDHFTSKGDTVVAWAIKAPTDKQGVVMNTVEAATGKLASALKGEIKPEAPKLQP
ncbi:MAG: hypothetical protein IT558_04135 [Alphaproteobacteria bacterium]|nr:hypothetical protein [Alphaproteobacteria bacterium]